MKISALVFLAEWEHVVDAWHLKSWENYRDVKSLAEKLALAGRNVKNFGAFLIMFGRRFPK